VGSLAEDATSEELSPAECRDLLILTRPAVTLRVPHSRRATVASACIQPCGDACLQQALDQVAAWMECPSLALLSEEGDYWPCL
jgi:hypothetical protein